MKNNKKPKENTTVIILPETDDKALCIEFTGLVNTEDYKRNLAANVAKMIENKGSYSILIRYGVLYQGWEEGAADTSLRTIMDLSKFGLRRAFVNAPEKMIMMQKMAGHLFGGETRYFNDDQFTDAMKWVKNGKTKSFLEKPIEIEKIENSATMAAELLKVMANEKRLMMLCALYEGEKSVTELMECAGLSQSAISQHLAAMRNKHIVDTRREKQTIYYYLGDQSIRDLMQVLCQIFKPQEG